MLLQVEGKGPFAPLKVPVTQFYSGFIEGLTRLLPRAQSRTKRAVEVRFIRGRKKKIGLPNRLRSLCQPAKHSSIASYALS